MTYWMIMGFSVALNGALGYWIYTLKKKAFRDAAVQIMEAAESIKDLTNGDELKKVEVTIKKSEFDKASQK